uniref:ATP-dependent Clp protease proteolytic subunit n=1 Tax=Brassica oleracea var. oleracea TaxID=109376 RepID=A0A0D3E412_BRAOL
MSSSDVVAQSAFDVLRLGRSSQFIVARLLRFWTPKTSRSFLTNGHQKLNRSFVAGSTKVCNPGLPLNVLGISFVVCVIAVQGKRVGHGTLMKSFSNQILATMLYLDTLDHSRRIYMFLNGPGGDLTPSLAIYDTMKSLKCPGQRFAMPLLRIALQSPTGAARGQLIVKDLSRLKRFNSEEAIEYGLIILRPPRIKDDAPLQDETSGLV